MDIIGWLIVLVGGFFILAAFIPQLKLVGRGMPITNPLVAVLIGAIVIGGGYYFGYVDFELEEVTPATVISGYATFNLDPSADQAAHDNTTLNDAETVFTTPFTANTTSGTNIYPASLASGAATTFVNPIYSFQVNPQIPTGTVVTADDLVTVYFEVTNPDTEVTGSTTDYRLIRKSQGVVFANWTVDDGTNTFTSKVDGSHTMRYTTTLWVNLSVEPYHTGAALIDQYSSEPIYIRFHNSDSSWSETYTANFLCTATV